MSAEQDALLRENLAALSDCDPALASSLSECAPDPQLTHLRAKNGMPVPAVLQSGAPLPLHSLYDPLQEARRIVQSMKGAGVLVLFGLGAGYVARAALEERSVHAVVVVEKDPRVLRALFQGASFASILRDRRTVLIAGAEGIRASLLSLWQPALMGTLTVVPLRPWCERERVFFDAAGAEVAAAVEAVRSDFSVQAHFGKRWFSNILLNLEAAEGSGPLPEPGSAAHVTAAGPSLDSQLAAVRAARTEGTLIASDTSLPALLQSGIHPHMVLSIDCQNHSYNHFLHGVPEETTLVLDLASPPFLARNRTRVSFVASGHPFVRYLASHWRAFPFIDTSGGNVTHAAVSLASTLGASTITIYGADFSYPGGKPYCRGSYIYDLFDARQDRCAPTESRMFSFLFRTSDVSRERTKAGLRYTTPVLLGYRDRLRELMRGSASEIIPIEGDGLSLSVQREAESTAARPAHAAWRVSAPRVGWRAFLGEYAEQLEALGEFGEDAGSSFHGLPAADRELWVTLFPVAAQVVLEFSGMTGGRAVNEARRWALSRLSHFL